jgi:L-iditol 2-dehydrogenase
MRSLKYYGPGNLKLEETPVPTPRAGEVLIAVASCGICATDLKTFLRGHPKIRPGAGLGHEVSGVVVDAPDSTRWKPGARVTVAPYVPCGTCPQCQRGHYSLCPHLFEELLDPGGFSEYVRVPERLTSQGMIALPDLLSFAAASFAEPVACCLHAFSSIQVHERDSLLVIGDGVMGLLQAEIGRVIGAHPIILSGMMPQRLEKARQIADIVVDIREQDLAAVVARETAGEGAGKVIVSVADAKAAQSAISLVRKGGAINLFAGMPQGSVLPLDMNRIHYDEIVLTGSFGFGPEDFQKALELIATGKLNVTRLITSSVPLSDSIGALEKLARQEGLKTIVLCGAEKV